MRMDPLSLTASLLAIIAAARLSIKQINEYRKAPKIIEDLSNELDCIAGLLLQVQKLIDCNGQSTHSDTLSAPLERANAKIDGLSQLISTYPSPRHIVISKNLSLWILKKNELLSLRGDLRAIRDDLNLGLLVISM